MSFSARLELGRDRSGMETQLAPSVTQESPSQKKAKILRLFLTAAENLRAETWSKLIGVFLENYPDQDSSEELTPAESTSSDLENLDSLEGIFEDIAHVAHVGEWKQLPKRAVELPLVDRLSILETLFHVTIERHRPKMMRVIFSATDETEIQEMIEVFSRDTLGKLLEMKTNIDLAVLETLNGSPPGQTANGSIKGVTDFRPSLSPHRINQLIAELGEKYEESLPAKIFTWKMIENILLANPEQLGSIAQLEENGHEVVITLTEEGFGFGTGALHLPEHTKNLTYDELAAMAQAMKVSIANTTQSRDLTSHLSREALYKINEKTYLSTTGDQRQKGMVLVGSHISPEDEIAPFKWRESDISDQNKSTIGARFFVEFPLFSVHASL